MSTTAPDSDTPPMAAAPPTAPLNATKSTNMGATRATKAILLPLASFLFLTFAIADAGVAGAFIATPWEAFDWMVNGYETDFFTYPDVTSAQAVQAYVGLGFILVFRALTSYLLSLSVRRPKGKWGLYWQMGFLTLSALIPYIAWLARNDLIYQMDDNGDLSLQLGKRIDLDFFPMLLLGVPTLYALTVFGLQGEKKNLIDPEEGTTAITVSGLSMASIIFACVVYTSAPFTIFSNVREYWMHLDMVKGSTLPHAVAVLWGWNTVFALSTLLALLAALSEVTYPQMKGLVALMLTPLLVLASMALIYGHVSEGRVSLKAIPGYPSLLQYFLGDFWIYFYYGSSGLLLFLLSIVGISSGCD
eukprot:TRINITY_DN2082_c0_g1_i1.p1 TRINITY_DN2082_c0_g1~~TRINITY_DN2082_c0_g1_i1.p1  ORF type:complete len:360 (-),score=64.35 TRINITY_DN2082_c0_g1_i1:235-1314(-)